MSKFNVQGSKLEFNIPIRVFRNQSRMMIKLVKIAKLELVKIILKASNHEDEQVLKNLYSCTCMSFKSLTVFFPINYGILEPETRICGT
jgi:hypothetical protein